jgi:hypothetical protein
MTPCHWAALIVIAAGIALAGAPAHAQSAQSAQSGNVTVIPAITVPKEFIPDLTIASGSVAATCVAKKTVTALVTATVKNVSPKGVADLSKATWQILVEVAWYSTTGPGNLEPPAGLGKQQLGGPKTLAPGATWPVKLTFTGIPRFKTSYPKQGQYGFAIRADPLKAVAEADETNNGLTVFAMDPCWKQ